MLAVHQVDLFARDEVGEKVRKPRVEPLVLEVVAYVRYRRRGRAEFEDTKAVERPLAYVPAGCWALAGRP